jgi:hypothetical protein
MKRFSQRVHPEHRTSRRQVFKPDITRQATRPLTGVSFVAKVNLLAFIRRDALHPVECQPANMNNPGVTYE